MSERNINGATPRLRVDAYMKTQTIEDKSSSHFFFSFFFEFKSKFFAFTVISCRRKLPSRNEKQLLKQRQKATWSVRQPSAFIGVAYNLFSALFLFFFWEWGREGPPRGLHSTGCRTSHPRFFFHGFLHEVRMVFEKFCRFRAVFDFAAGFQ